MQNKVTVTFVIGATATGKSTFIKNNFADADAIILNVYDYQQKAYDDAGFGEHIPFGLQAECLHKANAELLDDIIDNLKQNKNVVVEHTLFKAKRRITYINAIRQAIYNVNIEMYVMSPSETVWEEYIKSRELDGSIQHYKSLAEQIEFPNPIEGIDKIYEVVDDNIKLRMEEPKPDIIDTARNELFEEEQRLRRDKEAKAARKNLLESMNTRPFWHYCEVCGKKEFITAEEAENTGWDYPPTIGHFGLLSPRTCGSCGIKDTLFWKVEQQRIPIVTKKSLTPEELKTWERIENEPESLLTEEK